MESQRGEELSDMLEWNGGSDAQGQNLHPGLIISDETNSRRRGFLSRWYTRTPYSRNAFRRKTREIIVLAFFFLINGSKKKKSIMRTTTNLTRSERSWYWYKCASTPEPRSVWAAYRQCWDARNPKRATDTHQPKSTRLKIKHDRAKENRSTEVETKSTTQGHPSHYWIHMFQPQTAANQFSHVIMSR